MEVTEVMIDAEQALTLLKADLLSGSDAWIPSYNDGLEVAISEIEILARKERVKDRLEKRKEGRWTFLKGNKAECSECGSICYIACYPYTGWARYCPCCGAKMAPPQ